MQPSSAAPLSRPVYVFDLDDTLLSCNSFPVWAMTMLRGQVPRAGRRRQVATALSAGRLLFRRRLGLLPHAALKQELQALWRHATAGDGGTHAAQLGEALASRVRPNMADVLRQVRSGEVDAVLATAAAGEYAHALGRVLGFDAVLASDAGRDNVGEEKRRRVLAFLAERSWSERPIVLFTDHLDDLPLMLASKLVCWFGPDAEHAEIARRLPGIATIASRSLQSAEVAVAAASLPGLRQPA